MLASSMSLRGFRFLTHGEGTPGIFVHMETLRRFGMTELRQGQLVRYGPGPTATSHLARWNARNGKTQSGQ